MVSRPSSSISGPKRSQPDISTCFFFFNQNPKRYFTRFFDEVISPIKRIIKVGFGGSEKLLVKKYMSYDTRYARSSKLFAKI